MNITFVTGNQKKAEYLTKYLGMDVDHQKLDLDELQSLDLCKIVRHKVQQAYELIGSPVIVEDVGLEFVALGRLPGPFIKWFIEEIGLNEVCRLVTSNRQATARCVFGYYDGDTLELVESSLAGRIADKPAGDKGYGWDSIFIPKGYSVTRAELSESDNRRTYLQIKPLAQLKELISSIQTSAL